MPSRHGRDGPGGRHRTPAKAASPVASPPDDSAGLSTGITNDDLLATNPSGAPTGSPASPTISKQRDQHFVQQQVYQHQLQLLRMAQQQKPAFPTADLVRSLFMFAVALFSMYLVFTEYGWAMLIAVTLVLWISGFLRIIGLVLDLLFNSASSVTYNEALRRADIMMNPIVKKNTETGENIVLLYGCSSMQGWRRSMEDAHSLIAFDDGGFFAVYDGHSGNGTSRFCGSKMFDFVSNTAAYKDGNYPTALYDGFIAIDRHLFNTHGPDRSGCTAVVLLVKGDELYCANAGDSRCVVCRDGEAFPLSVDHKPFLPSEQTRIERAGGYVWNRRVNGVLALSRAIGDFGFKSNTQVSWDQQAVTSAPEVRSTRLNRDKDEFAVIACDGIWDVMSSEQVVEFVRQRLQQRISPGIICENLMDACLATQPFGIGCDNMSVIIVQFKRIPQGGSGSFQRGPVTVPSADSSTRTKDDAASSPNGSSPTGTGGQTSSTTGAVHGSPAAAGAEEQEEQTGGVVYTVVDRTLADPPGAPDTEGSGNRSQADKRHRTHAHSQTASGESPDRTGSAEAKESDAPLPNGDGPVDFLSTGSINVKSPQSSFAGPSSGSRNGRHEGIAANTSGAAVAYTQVAGADDSVHSHSKSHDSGKHSSAANERGSRTPPQVLAASASGHHKNGSGDMCVNGHFSFSSSGEERVARPPYGSTVSQNASSGGRSSILQR